jgi:hypothetical protein
MSFEGAGVTGRVRAHCLTLGVSGRGDWERGCGLCAVLCTLCGRKQGLPVLPPTCPPACPPNHGCCGGTALLAGVLAVRSSGAGGNAGCGEDISYNLT